MSSARRVLCLAPIRKAGKVFYVPRRRQQPRRRPGRFADEGRPSAMSLDYSKWDRICDDLLESDDEKELKRGQNKPKVTTFGKPTRVTISPSGPVASSPSGAAATSPSGAAARPPSGPAATSSPDVAAAPASGGVAASPPPRKARAELDDPKFYRNGSRFDAYCWSQDADQVTLSVFLPQGTQTKQISASLSPTVELGGSGSGGADTRNESKMRLCVKLDGKAIVEGLLAYAVLIDEDADGGIDWELKGARGSGRRRWIATMRKVSPVANARIWWNRLFEQEPKIDVTQIQDRRKASKSMKSLWDDAHRMFREKVRTFFARAYTHTHTRTHTYTTAVKRAHHRGPWWSS